MKDDLLDYLIATDSLDEFLGNDKEIKTIDLEDYMDDEEESDEEEGED